MTRPARTRVRHGMASCRRYGCQRPECRAAALKAQRATRADLKKGRRARVDATPARLHGAALLHAGMPAYEIAMWTGLSATTVTNLINGSYVQVYRDTADAVLTLPVPRRGYRPVRDGLVDATAARRRLQALSALGFTLPLLAEQIGVTEETVGAIRQRRREQLRISLNQAIAAVYDRLWRADPLELGASPSGVIRAKSWAAKQGWPPPAAWDDDRIAEHDSEPHTHSEAEIGRSELAQVRLQEIQHLAAFNLPEHEIADRLGMARNYVHDLIRDMGKAA